MTDFLLELRSEEIPARMQDGARAELAKLFGTQMAAAGIAASNVSVWSTPRRLALIARGLPVETAAVSEEYKGPRTSAPAQALDGFLRKTGLTQDQLEDRDGVWFANVEKPGRATADVLAEAIPAIIRAFAWPKSMRWGRASTTTESLRWVRPLQGIVAIFGEALVPCEVDGIASGFATRGHRFHHSGEITVGGAHDYAARLRDAHVIVDQDERRAIIRNACVSLTHAHGLAWVEDEGLVAENAGLTEWPVPLLGDFDPAFLEVPPEVVRLTLAVNQKYFVAGNPPRDGEVARSDGGGAQPSTELEDENPLRPLRGHLPASGEDFQLAPAFICTANIEASDGGTAIVAGNRKVLAARLSDARFFWDQDKKVRLEDHAKKLSRITFHEKLGTVADKVERVAKLARWLVEEGIIKPSPLQGRGLGEGAERSAASVGSAPAALPLSPALSPEGEREKLATLAEQAAKLCKADLVTEMVGEFPELQGVMGGYYAREEKLDPQIADAIRDHYKPVGQGDDVPTAPVTVAVSLADKLDTLFMLFGTYSRPTGSKDPFALRRAAIGIVRLLDYNDLRLSVVEVCELLYKLHVTKNKEYINLLQDRNERLDEPEWLIAPPVWIQEIDAIFAGDIVEKFIYHPIDFTNPYWKSYELGFISPDRWPGEEPVAMGVPIDFAEDVLHGFPPFSENYDAVLSFLTDRLKVQQREAGVRHDLIDAVFALGGEDDLVRLLARVKALQAFVGTADGVNLLAGYKRAANILKKEGGDKPLPFRGGAGVGTVHLEHGQTTVPTPNPSPEGEGGYSFEPAEAALIAALDAAEPRAAAAVEAERFEEAMAALASLRAPIDSFFDSVTVNDADPAKRAARLALLARLTAAVGRIADFSKIEG